MAAVSVDSPYLLDTHAVIFWHTREEMPAPLQALLDHAAARGNVLISGISFWEAALLVKNGRIEIPDVTAWKNEILKYSGARLDLPDADDMIASVALPDYHGDPFDRLLIAQARRRKAVLVSRNRTLEAYGIPMLWSMD